MIFRKLPGECITLNSAGCLQLVDWYWLVLPSNGVWSALPTPPENSPYAPNDSSVVERHWAIRMGF